MLTDIILPAIERYANVSEIIISHGKQETAFNYKSKHCRIVHREDWDLNKTYGLSLRFLAGREAVNEIVFQQNDDILIPEETIDDLLARYQKQPDVLHGLVGRIPDLSFRYNFNDIYGATLMVLTSGVLFKRELQEYCLGQHFEEMQDFMRQSNFKVLWNGEEIYQSLVAFKHSGLPNMAYNLPWVCLESIADNSEAVSSHPSHETERTKFLRYAIEKMDLQEQATELIKSISGFKTGNTGERTTDTPSANSDQKATSKWLSPIKGRLFSWLLKSGCPYAVRRRLLARFYKKNMRRLNG